ncbi:MAG: hypothetical protein ACYC27_05150 [Armatimonadota bacterium]
MYKVLSLGMAMVIVFAGSVLSADKNNGKEIISTQKVKTFYSIDDERYVYSYAWNKSAKPDGPGPADGSTRADGKPWTFNWCSRRDPGFVISGDLPRVALARRYKMPSTLPPIISLGDLRIRCTSGGKSYLLDEADEIQTIFHPWGTEHKVKINTPAPLTFNIRTTLVENRCMAVQVRTSAESNTPVDAEIELIYGGVSDKGNSQQATTYITPSPKDAEKNTLTPITGGVIIGSPGIPSTVTAIADSADEVTIASPDSGDVTGNRAVFKYKLRLANNASTIRFLAFENESADQAGFTFNNFDKYHNDSVDYYSRLLAPFEISTPDPVLNAGFYTALVNFDYVYQSPAWLEGVHCWSAPLIDNYPISAAVSLGQLDRARDALMFFADTEVGPCPMRLADGSPSISGSFGFEEGIPYYIEQLHRYWQATGDDTTVDRMWDSLVKNFEKYWTVRDPEGNMLLNYHESSNCFLYQADHLSLPGDSSSPSIIMTDCLEKMADMAESRNDKESAAKWRHRAEYMRSELIRRLWSPEQGKFIAAIDYQGFPMQANYYTDFVFPELYSKLPSEYSWISLKTLDRTLWVGDHLMRVGNLKPSLFGNDNVMPVQMSEAAEAYCEAGRSDEGYRLLHGTALGASIYTDSPGSFPERMSDTGLGLSDYVFGNPTAAFIRGTTAGLFGIERVSADRPMSWHPAIPDSWKSASIRLDDISVSVTGVHGDRTYSISLPHTQNLDFRIPLHGHHTIKVLNADGASVPYAVTGHPSGGFLHIQGTGADKYTFQVVSEKPDASWNIPAGLRAGRKINIKLPQAGLSITDPQKVFADFRIEGDMLTGRLAKEEGLRTFFLNERDGQSIIPVDLDLGTSRIQKVKLSPAAGKREHLALDGLFNSDAIMSRNMWRFSPVTLDMTKAVTDGDKLAVGDFTFKVRPSGMNIIITEVGLLDSYTNALKLSDKPHSVRMNVGKAVKGIELLMASEWRVRLTGMQVGQITLHYADGSDQFVPLVNGQNAGSINGRYQDGVVHKELEWLKNIYALPIAADPTRMLEYIEVSVRVPDGSTGILAGNLVRE